VSQSSCSQTRGRQRHDRDQREAGGDDETQFRDEQETKRWLWIAPIAAEHLSRTPEAIAALDDSRKRVGIWWRRRDA
jgi:hypothetical protein